jgi:hydroxymethylglutaryl-CoA lyase
VTPLSSETGTAAVQVVDVAPRDGFQSIAPFIPTEHKFELITHLWEAGLRRIEVGSFVSATAVPQLRDTAELLSACGALPGVVPQVLVATERRGRQAVEAGATFLVFVLSVSAAHNQSNVRRDPLESAEEYGALLAGVSTAVDMRVDVATAFDCPFTGRVPIKETIALLDRIVPMRPQAEICLCDTTGRVAPDHVAELFDACMDRYGTVTRWAFHAHDTYGLGLANVLAAYRRGVRVFDASVGGIGGCPFAPGATGNVATEDVVWMFERMGIATGIDIARLVSAAEQAAGLAGAIPGGRVREALLARQRLDLSRVAHG